MSNRFQVMPSLLVQGPHWKHCPECLVPPGGDIHGSFPVHLMEFRLSMSLQVKKKKEKKSQWVGRELRTVGKQYLRLWTRTELPGV